MNKMKTILVVEDDKILRENISDFLREEGYKVLNAEDGLEGLQVVMKHLPDLIICDIMMPRMNGYEFFKTIQEIKATSSIPLIFLTAKSEKEDFRTGMHLGADDYISKPFDFGELLLSVKTRLDKLERIHKKNDEKFYALIDNPLMGVFIYSKNKFDFINEKCASIFGLKQSEAQHMTFEDLVIGPDRDVIIKKIERCFNKIQTTLHGRFKARHSNGKKEVTVEMYAGMFNNNGADSLIGNMVECSGIGNALIFSGEKDISAGALSKKELKILSLVCKGLSNAEIAEILGRSKRTIETHRAHIISKTNVKNSADLVIYAIRNGLI